MIPVFLRTWLVFLLVLRMTTETSVFAQVSGKVLMHSPANKATSLGGVSVKGYVYDKIARQEKLITQAVTNHNGHYLLNVPAGQSVRVVFECQQKAVTSLGHTPSIRYVKSPMSNLDWQVVEDTGHDENGGYAVSPVYIQGKGNDSTHALVAIGLDSQNLPVVRKLAPSGLTGSLWGITYQKSTGQLFSSSFAKRHAGFGVLGTGGIYRTDWASAKTSAYLDLRSLGIDTGPDRHRDLTEDEASKSRDSLLVADVGKLSLGGMDVGSDGNLYVMNLFDQTLYRIRIPADTSQRPTSEDIAAFGVPASFCKGGVCRPFAVKVYQGRVYIGAVCDASLSKKAEDLKAVVYRLEEEAQRFDLVFSMDLNYQRGEGIEGFGNSGWNSWTDDFTRSLNPDFPSLAYYPQPLLSSIDFDVDGSMILGLMDRFGHQSGVGQPDPTGRFAVSGVAAGDLVRVTKQESNSFSARVYKLESEGTAGKPVINGGGSEKAPSGGGFSFEDDFYDNTSTVTRRIIHQEIGSGGLALLPATGEVLTSAHEPGDAYNAGGIRAYYTTNGRYSRSWDFYKNGQSGTFGKTNGIGGVLVISAGPALSFGTRIWLDINQDGLQDAHEPGLGNIPVEVWRNDRLIATVTSDSEGRCYFNDENLRAEITPNTSYLLKINVEQLGMVVSPASQSWTDPDRDNDAVTHAGQAVVSLTTGNTFFDTMGFSDFGLTVESGLPHQADQKETGLTMYPNPASERVELKWKTSGPSAVVEILETGGKVIQTRELHSESTTHHEVFDIAQWSSGSYIVRIREKSTNKIVSAILLKQ